MAKGRGMMRFLPAFIQAVLPDLRKPKVADQKRDEREAKRTRSQLRRPTRKPRRWNINRFSGIDHANLQARNRRAEQIGKGMLQPSTWEWTERAWRTNGSRDGHAPQRHRPRSERA